MSRHDIIEWTGINPVTQRPTWITLQSGVPDRDLSERLRYWRERSHPKAEAIIDRSVPLVHLTCSRKRKSAEKNQQLTF